MGLLLFISKAPQLLKAFFKEFRAIISVAILQKIGIFFISTMIFFPGLVKADPFKQREIDSVFMNGFLVLEKLPFEPLSISRNQAAVQDVEKMIFAESFYAIDVYGGTEFDRRFNDCIAPISSGGKGMVKALVDQCTYEDQNKSEKDTVKPSFWSIQLENPFKHEPTDTLLWWMMLFFVAFVWPFISHKVWPFKYKR